MALATLPEFHNEPYADFAQPALARRRKQPCARWRSEFGREYLLRIGGDWIATGDALVSVNPPIAAKPWASTTEPRLSWPTTPWKPRTPTSRSGAATPAAERVRMLLEAARILRARKMEFDAWLVLEAGKTWPEAEADVSEAIDFCEYYAREMLRLAGAQRLHQLPASTTRRSTSRLVWAW